MPPTEITLARNTARTSASIAPPAPIAPVPALPGKLIMQGISKNFPNSTVGALHNIDLTCKPGEFVVVVGPSGCGKSTLLNIAAGMIHPDAGQILLDGRSIDAPGPERAMVFQDHGFFPWLTAAQNVEFGLKMARVPASQRRDRVNDALKMVHLTNSAKKLVHELSGGMRQRIAIARALVMNPAVLLMDEPFAALDAQTRTLLHHQVQTLWVETKKTILFVTHSVGEAVRLADRIIILHSQPGRIRKEIAVQLPHPRKFDSADINELVRIVRKEIEDEVNRINTLAADQWNPPEAPDLGPASDDLGSGI